jgi:formylglycine-generating enzyme required for sulfatase activity
MDACIGPVYGCRRPPVRGAGARRSAGRRYDRADRHVLDVGAAREGTAAWLGLGVPAGAPPAPVPPRHRAGSRPAVPALDDCVAVPAGEYRLGEPGEERTVAMAGLRLGRFPVVNAHWRAFAVATGRAVPAAAGSPALADHPVTGITLAEAGAFCAWASGRLGRRVRLPTGDEWEAAARGADARTWPWGDVFDPDRCNCAEAASGWTVPVTAHPDGASAAAAEQLAGNVWEWVAGTEPDGWATVRGGSYLDTAWGLRAARALPADPCRATPTTGFRIVLDHEPGGPS